MSDINQLNGIPVGNIARATKKDGSIQFTYRQAENAYFMAAINSASSHVRELWKVQYYLLLPNVVTGRKWEYFCNSSFCTAQPIEAVELLVREQIKYLTDELSTKEK